MEDGFELEVVPVLELEVGVWFVLLLPELVLATEEVEVALALVLVLVLVPLLLEPDSTKRLDVWVVLCFEGLAVASGEVAGDEMTTFVMAEESIGVGAKDVVAPPVDVSTVTAHTVRPNRAQRAKAWMEYCIVIVMVWN